MLQSWRIRPVTGATLAAVVALIGLATTRAERVGLPYRPDRDDQVLPLQAAVQRAAAATQRAALHAASAGQSEDPRRLLALAQQEIERARLTGDMRPLGRAEALLARVPGPESAELLVMRATIAQARHAFPAALADLERALALDPSQAQAHLTRAALLTVLGRYAEARSSCAALVGLAPEFVSVVCAANLDGYTGARERALALLERALAQLPNAPARAWAGSLLCEQSFWGGALAQAERACASALALDPGDRYTRALYLDVLLESGQAERALGLSGTSNEDDALLLRRALAALALRRAEAAALVAQLQARFERARARGDRVHQREEARLLLALGAEPARALALASEGFRAQRELWDIRLLLSAAVAAKDARAARPALAFLRENQLRSAPLDRLVAQLAGGAS